MSKFCKHGFTIKLGCEFCKIEQLEEKIKNFEATLLAISTIPIKPCIESKNFACALMKVLANKGLARMENGNESKDN